jgi:hypothetical protein
VGDGVGVGVGEQSFIHPLNSAIAPEGIS